MLLSPYAKLGTGRDPGESGRAEADAELSRCVAQPCGPVGEAALLPITTRANTSSHLGSGLRRTRRKAGAGLGVMLRQGSRGLLHGGEVRPQDVRLKLGWRQVEAGEAEGKCVVHVRA